MKGQKIYGIKESSDLIGVSKETLKRWEKEKRIPTLSRIGTQRVLSSSQIQTIKNAYKKFTVDKKEFREDVFNNWVTID